MGENIFLALKKQHKKKQKHEAQQGIEMEGKKKEKATGNLVLDCKMSPRALVKSGKTLPLLQPLARCSCGPYYTAH